MLRFKTEMEIDLDDEDIEFVVQQVWRSRCAVSKSRFGGHIILTLTRWDSSQPPSVYNLVLMMQRDAQRMAELGKEQAFSKEVIEKIDDRLRWAKDLYCKEENLEDVKYRYQRYTNSLNEYCQVIHSDHQTEGSDTLQRDKSNTLMNNNTPHYLHSLSLVLFGATIASVYYNKIV